MELGEWTSIAQRTARSCMLAAAEGASQIQQRISSERRLNTTRCATPLKRTRGIKSAHTRFGNGDRTDALIAVSELLADGPSGAAMTEREGHPSVDPWKGRYCTCKRFPSRHIRRLTDLSCTCSVSIVRSMETQGGGHSHAHSYMLIVACRDKGTGHRV